MLWTYSYCRCQNEVKKEWKYKAHLTIHLHHSYAERWVEHLVISHLCAGHLRILWQLCFKLCSLNELTELASESKPAWLKTSAFWSVLQKKNFDVKIKCLKLIWWKWADTWQNGTWFFCCVSQYLPVNSFILYSGEILAPPSTAYAHIFIWMCVRLFI